MKSFDLFMVVGYINVLCEGLNREFFENMILEIKDRYKYLKYYGVFLL